jgi:hypothetical protein
MNIGAPMAVIALRERTPVWMSQRSIPADCHTGLKLSQLRALANTTIIPNQRKKTCFDVGPRNIDYHGRSTYFDIETDAALDSCRQKKAT